MKKNFRIITLTVLVSFGLFSLFGFERASPILDTHRVGDVVYSVLAPADFVKEHGPGWVLMKGDTIKESRLYTDYGIGIAPNACGRFLRGMNYQGIGDDPDNRTVGSYQKDEFMEHAHAFSYQRANRNSSNGGSSNHEVSDNESKTDSKTEKTGGKETRPRNIALYIYMKIND